MVDTEELDYSKIFYAGSAVFAVLSVLYLGFEYLQDLSPFTIAAVLFAVFLSMFAVGVTRKSRVKFVYFLTSAGSYLVFLVYVNGRFLDTSNQVLASLVLSAVLFSLIGYVLTNRRDLLPDRGQVRYVIAGLAVLLAVLVAYDILFVGATFAAELDDEAVMEPSEQVVGEVEIAKDGYLPVVLDRRTVSFCVRSGDDAHYIPVRQSYGGDMTGFAPETQAEDIVLDLGERFFEDVEHAEELTDVEEGQVLELVAIDDCNVDALEEGLLGVVLDEDWVRKGPTPSG